MNIQAIYEQIIKTGLTKYRFKDSKASLPALVAANKEDQKDVKGAIFAVRDKSHFNIDGKVKGFILTSKESLIDNEATISHWTPNVYRTYTYTDETRKFIQGFSDDNLLQVNTFVVDIDTKKHSPQDILMACLDDSIGLPTLILESTRGYQVYFVLEKPIYISNAHKFRSLDVAKTIATNLKRSLTNVDADIYCNNFGFFRLPTVRNIVFYQSDLVYTAAELINWSKRQSDDRNENPFRVITTVPTAIQNVMESDWFQALIHATHIKGQKGRLGRNNTTFTLALLCLQNGWDSARTLDFLDEFNTSLAMPLKHTEVMAAVRSAYSGKYQGASSDYIHALLEEYLPNHSFEVKLGKTTWHKFKKARADRERSHYDEWGADLEAYLTAQFDVSEPFIWRTQKEICAALKMPSSTLNELIKTSKTIIRTVTGSGSTKKTGWTTLTLFKKHVLARIQENKKAYRTHLMELLDNDLVEWTSSPATKTALEFIHLILLSIDARPIDISVVNTS